jgi:hypothetical protein
VVSVFGPTDPAVYGPYHPRAPAVVLRHDLPCSPCYTMASGAECPLGDPICMRLVTVTQVVQSVLEVLTSSQRSVSDGAAGCSAESQMKPEL